MVFGREKMKQYKLKLKKWYDSTAENYDNWGENEGEFLVGDKDEEIKQFNKILDEIKINKNSKILDIGTGTGRFLIEAVKRFGVGYGIDFSSKMLNVFKKKINKLKISDKIIELKVGDALSIKYPDNTFDLILCMGVFDYYGFFDVKKFLDEMKRVAKNECFFIVDFPNKENKETFEFRNKERSVGHEVFIHEYKDICNFLEENGFNILITKKAEIEIQFLLEIK